MADSIEHLLGPGLAHHQSGRLAEARALYLKVLQMDAAQPIALHMLGLLALTEQDFGQAVTLFEKALTVNPNNGDAACNLGVALRGLGRLDEAVDAFRRAGPEDATALYNLGLTFNDQGRFEEAGGAYEAAVAVKPDYLEAHVNLGNALWDLGRLDEAEKRFQLALEAAPDNPEVHKTLGFLQLLRGSFESGWQNYAWRLKEPDNPLKKASYPGRLWEGEPIAGKTLLVYHEQGLGDVIQFARYLPLVQQRGARIVFEVQAPLVGLMETSGLADRVVRAGATLPAYDFHVPLLELPRLFETDATNIPSETPYLRVSTERLAAWKSRLAGDGTLKVGIAWAGNPVNKVDRKRSMPPDLFLPLAAMDGVSLFSLQVGREGEARSVLGGAITDLAPLFADFADTAAAMDHLDLIISVDTAVAHLAGALGRPVWTLLPKWPDWRWLLERDDSPWYPSMTLFRQETVGDWPPVIGRLLDNIMKR